MTQLRLRSSSVHERGSGSSSGAVGFHDCGSCSGALFFHGSGSSSASVRFHTIIFSMVLVCLKLKEKEKYEVGYTKLRECTKRF